MRAVRGGRTKAAGRLGNRKVAKSWQKSIMRIKKTLTGLGKIKYKAPVFDL